jgi:hypothetical protein
MLKKIYLCLALCTGVSLTSIGQSQLINGGFETWDNPSAATAEPTQWNSNKTGLNFAPLGPQTCFREASIVHSGTYSARIKTGSYLGTTVNGALTTGRVAAPSTNPSQGYNTTVTTDALYNTPLTDTPDTIVFWAYYTPGGGDLARVSAILHQNYAQRDPFINDPNGSTNVIAQAAQNFGTTSSAWKRFSIPFDYATFNNNNAPAFILVTFTSSYQPGSGSTSSTLYVDDVSLVYTPVLTTGTISPLQYYVSATAGSSISVPYTLTGTMNGSNQVIAELSDAGGSFANPVVLGTISATSSGTINGTIPAGTPAGNGYRIRVRSTDYPLTAADNGTDIQIISVSASVTPTAAQIIEAGVNGSMLTVNATAGYSGLQWVFSTVSGGSYAAIWGGTAGSYMPNFAISGTYYVACQATYPGGITVTSNEVEINVADNSVTPSGSQSILISTPGTLLTVTETPTGTSRVWKYATAPGGPYVTFSPAETSSTYTPLFATGGTYYVVCESQILGITVRSNEVEISVSTITLNTGTITGSPFEFSPSAPDAVISVPYTVSTSFNAGNVFTAQLSDANGSFGSPLSIGTVSATSNGTISATIPSTTPAGTGYRIRVIGNNPGINGSDNGVNLIIDQFNNQINPSNVQNIGVSVNGNPLTVTESQSAISREWLYSTNPGGPYQSFTPTETGTSYTPIFATPGLYYVVCKSINTYNDPVTSNEVIINVSNGTTLSTSAVTGSPFYTSPSANVTVDVNFSSNIIFDAANVFTAQLSDASGSFASPVSIGTLNGNTIGTISAIIPNSSPSGNGYRIRVVSSSPAFSGTDNGTNLQVIPFANNIAPLDTQAIFVSVAGTPVTVTESHPGCTREWKFRNSILAPFASFSPAETGTQYTPLFAAAGTYQVTCFSVNTWGDTTQSEEIIIKVSGVGIDEHSSENIRVLMNGENILILPGQSFDNGYTLTLSDMSGRVLAEQKITQQENVSIPTPTVAGVYILSLQTKSIRRSIKILRN